jgi:allantoate deiminase
MDEHASVEASAQTVMERCAALGAISEEPERLTRRYATDAMRRVNALVADWMRDAGMAVRQDTIGNIIGRYDAATPSANTLLLGSHLDTVRDAGKYDGPLGVMVALACVERLHVRGERLPYAVEVYGFADEEGLRFHTAYLGSSAVAGTLAVAETLPHDRLTLTDADGVTLADAIRAFGGDPDRLADDVRPRDDLFGYVEVHIEQGPVLEAEGLPVGVVSAISGQSRVAVEFTGVAGHAGTVPMALRRDALCAASEFVLAVEAFGRETDGLVATVGQLSVQPGASNVIPGQVTLSLDVRHPDDATRKHAREWLTNRAREIWLERHLAGGLWRVQQENVTVACAPRLIELLARAIVDGGYPVRILPSGAGHDAVQMAHLTDVGMLFVRCKGGVSHNPAESVDAGDVAVAIATLERLLALLAAEQGRVG